MTGSVVFVRQLNWSYLALYLVSILHSLRTNFSFALPARSRQQGQQAQLNWDVRAQALGFVIRLPLQTYNACRNVRTDVKWSFVHYSETISMHRLRVTLNDPIEIAGGSIGMHVSLGIRSSPVVEFSRSRPEKLEDSVE